MCITQKKRIIKSELDLYLLIVELRNEWKCIGIEHTEQITQPNGFFLTTINMHYTKLTLYF